MLLSEYDEKYAAAEDQEPAPVSPKKSEGKKKSADGMCMYVMLKGEEKVSTDNFPWPISQECR